MDAFVNMIDVPYIIQNKILVVVFRVFFIISDIFLVSIFTIIK